MEVKNVTLFLKRHFIMRSNKKICSAVLKCKKMSGYRYVDVSVYATMEKFKVGQEEI